MSRKSGASTLVSSMTSGSRDFTTDTEGGALGLEDDVRPRPRPPLLLVAPGRCRSGTPRRSRTGARGRRDRMATSRTMRSASAWNASGTSTERATTCSTAFESSSCTTCSSVWMCACSCAAIACLNVRMRRVDTAASVRMTPHAAAVCRTLPRESPGTPCDAHAIAWITANAPTTAPCGHDRAARLVEIHASTHSITITCRIGCIQNWTAHRSAPDCPAQAPPETAASGLDRRHERLTGTIPHEAGLATGAAPSRTHSVRGRVRRLEPAGRFAECG